MAIWWRPVYGFSRFVALVIAALTIMPIIGNTATHATPDKDLIYWRDISTGFAVGGYDPVAYFVDARPRLGTGEFEYDWQGVTWRFVSAANRAVFVRDPTVYAPRYGGYGAQGVARGVLAPGNPEDWLIYEDRLFFFTNAAQRRSWREQAKTQRRSADIFWPKINRELEQY